MNASGAALVGSALACASLVAASAPASAAPQLRSAAAPAAELRPSAAHAIPRGGEIRRFQQRVAGYRVFDAEAVVADPAEGSADLVVDQTVAGIDPPRPATVGRDTAVALARVASQAGALRVAPLARLGIEPQTGGLAWRVLLASGWPLADYEVTVDARSARVLETRDLLRRGTGTSALFDPNPLVTHGSSKRLRDRKDRNSRLLQALRVPVELPRLTNPRGCLKGAFVKVDLGHKGRLVCKRSRNWTVGRSANRFEALMAYYHVDRTRVYIESLGLDNGLRDRPMPVHANAIRADQSFYTPIGHDVTLGTGGVDDGEDGDVIVHEYGHAIQDQQVSRFGRRPQGVAMGEGFGDYIAAVMSGVSTGGSERFDPCMFEWDATSYTRNRCLRRTDTDITKTQAKRRCFGDPHCVGEAWSGALWELRALLGSDGAGRSVMDRVLIQSHLLLTRNSNLRDGARALIAADRLLYSGTHAAAIEAEMVQRRFCSTTGC
ncbi:MAG TPA: M36 family metallopeptidase [Solirubrobacterales bacterium]|jgi:Fungalysin metallopeptidase (M36)|nr:M36 family metallopeptidase [Solirubrobacterales bacterium]